MANKTLFFGGDIVTMDEALPSAEAVAVINDKIVAVGQMEKCKTALGKNYEPADLRGLTLLPGFIDTHLHPAPMIFYDMNVDLGAAASFEELHEKMRLASLDTPLPNWVVGLNFDEQFLDKPALPTRHDIDKSCKDRPAIIIKHDGHMVMANTKAIFEAGLTASSPNPAGGAIDREPDGFPSGIFRENAARLILDAMPTPSFQSIFDGAELTFKNILAAGITSIGAVLQTYDEGPAGKSGALDVLLMNALIDRIPVNVCSLLIADDIEKIRATMKTKIHSNVPGSHKVAGIKIYSDGTFGSRTALMKEPYSDDPDRKGFLTTDENIIYERMLAAHNEGLQVCVHAIGDAANGICVNLFGKLLRAYPRRDPRHRIEHASQLDESTIADIARLGIIASVQPQFIFSEKDWLEKRLGKKRLKWTYPFRSLLDAGVKIVGASDAPVESINVLHSIQVCATRDGFEPQECISVADALKMFTIDAAFSQNEENIKGSLSAGKRADMTVLSDNPLKIPPEKIKNVEVLKTIVGGAIKFEK